jgi:hypothetical protein
VSPHPATRRLRRALRPRRTRSTAALGRGTTGPESATTDPAATEPAASATPRTPETADRAAADVDEAAALLPDDGEESEFQRRAEAGASRHPRSLWWTPGSRPEHERAVPTETARIQARAVAAHASGGRCSGSPRGAIPAVHCLRACADPRRRRPACRGPRALGLGERRGLRCSAGGSQPAPWATGRDVGPVLGGWPTSRWRRSAQVSARYHPFRRGALGLASRACQ